jgi:alcohol dehydrogenase (cytochrome c)
MKISELSRRAVVAAALTLSMTPFAAPALAADVTFDRLKAAQTAEPQNWLTTYGGYNSYSHSPLKEITRDNVQGLHVKFMYAIGGSQPASVGGVAPGQRATPLVKDGFMYVQNAWDVISKIDVSKGDSATPVWTTDLGAEGASSKMGSVALLGKYVYYVTRNDMHMYKIDDETGDIVWDVDTRGPDNVAGAERATGGTIAIKNMIITSAAGPGMRAWIAAFSADDGKLLWRFYTVPGPGEPGHETWLDDHNAYLTGGAGVWTTPSYDPDSNSLIFGTGEAQPWADPAFRPGDDLYTNSTIALDPDTGKMKWYFQEVPQETWDYDTVNPKMLYDITYNGESRKVVGTFSRNGFFYTLDRNNGSFIYGTAYRDPNWTAGLDPKTGKPVEYVPGSATQQYANNKTLKVGDTATAQDTCPALPTATWWPPTYDPDSHIAYIQAIDACFNQSIDQHIDPARTDLKGNPGMWGGGNFWKFDYSFPNAPGLIIAVDTQSGKKLAQITTDYPTNSGLLSTAGGLVFGGNADGKLIAYDSATMKQVWSFNTGTPIGAPPISYAIDGKQYIAVVTGGSPAGNPKIAGMQSASQVVVFGLDE